jgi:hypothetical protein
MIDAFQSFEEKSNRQFPKALDCSTGTVQMQDE